MNVKSHKLSSNISTTMRTWLIYKLYIGKYCVCSWFFFIERDMIFGKNVYGMSFQDSEWNPSLSNFIFYAYFFILHTYIYYQNNIVGWHMNKTFETVFNWINHHTSNWHLIMQEHYDVSHFSVMICILCWFSIILFIFTST